MLIKVPLKNSNEVVLVDEHVYQYLTDDPYLTKIGFVESLRKHSSGCAVFQKTWKTSDSGYSTETIYLHKLIAEKFLKDDRNEDKNLVGAKNGNKLDCQLENLTWRSRATASRQRRTSSRIGYTGVYKENNRYRAVISIGKKSVHLGMYDSPEEAAAAYNAKSRELYGTEGKQNLIQTDAE